MKKLISTAILTLFILILVGCDNTPATTEEDRSNINSEAQQEAKEDRLKNIVGYMIVHDESTKIYANDFFEIYTHFGSWDQTYYPEEWDNSDYQQKLGNTHNADLEEAVYEASYGNGYCKTAVSIRKENKDENFQPETHIDNEINQFTDPDFTELAGQLAPELLDAEYSKITTTFCGQKMPALYITDFSEEYGHRYYEKSIWIKKDGFIAKVSAFSYDEDITNQIFNQYFNNISTLKNYLGIPTDHIENKSSDQADKEFDLWQVITDKTTLNIREEPSSDSKKVGYLKKGTVARITKYDSTGEWGYVNDLESNDREGFSEGWINLEYCTDRIAMGGGWVYLVIGEPYYHIRSCEKLNQYSDDSIKAWPMDDAEVDNYKPCPQCGGF